MSSLVLKTTNRVAFEEQPPKPDPRVLLFTRQGRASSKLFYATLDTVVAYEASSNDLYNTVNVIFPQLIPA